MYGRCSMQNVIESDGSVYPCDFYAMDPWLMGNIRDPEAGFERFLEQAAAGEGAGGFFARPGPAGRKMSGLPLVSLVPRRLPERLL